MIKKRLKDAVFWILGLVAVFPLQGSRGENCSMEGLLDSHLGNPFMVQEVVFDERDRVSQELQNPSRVREPYLAVGADGSVLVLRNHVDSQLGRGHLRRSEDGGKNWSDIIEVPFGFLDTNFIVDEKSGDILVVRLWSMPARQWRSRDQGRTWEEESTTVIPNLHIRNLEEKGGLRWGGRFPVEEGVFYLHGNAGESGIALRHGNHEGRLILTATFRPHSSVHPSDRDDETAIYSCAIFSDDGGESWQVSALFPEGWTEEAALVELSDGRIYYNSRSHAGFFRQEQRELPPEAHQRREAWSTDGGATWEHLRINRVLSDGGGVGRGYGMKAGLARLPVKGRDILLYSNADTAGGARERLTVWASFDGGLTWPVKRLVHPSGHSGYSSMGVGRPGTPGEGMVFILYEAVSSMRVARFNLSWILQGEATGDGAIPEWIDLHLKPVAEEAVLATDP